MKRWYDDIVHEKQLNVKIVFVLTAGVKDRLVIFCVDPQRNETESINLKKWVVRLKMYLNRKKV